MSIESEFKTEVTKRGPGRPRGSKNKKTIVSKTEVTKRGPGRPKGSKNRKKPIEVSVESGPKTAEIVAQKRLYRCKYFKCRKSFYSEAKRNHHQEKCQHRDDETMRPINCHYPPSIIDMLDILVESGIFPNRSEAIRHFVINGIRDYTANLLDYFQKKGAD